MIAKDLHRVALEVPHARGRVALHFPIIAVERVKRTAVTAPPFLTQTLLYPRRHGQIRGGEGYLPFAHFSFRHDPFIGHSVCLQCGHFFEAIGILLCVSSSAWTGPTTVAIREKFTATVTTSQHIFHGRLPRLGGLTLRNTNLVSW